MTTINTNAYSLNAQRNLAKNSLGLGSALERLSSGLRVNSSKDDAAGLAVGMNMDKFAREMSADIRKESDNISKAQIADGALAVVGDILGRLSELQKQHDNYAGDATSQAYIKTEIDSLVTAAGTIQGAAKFNGTVTYTAITVASGATAITNAITSVATERAKQGSAINTGEFTIQSLRVNYENQQAAKSRIMDADFAEETSRLSRFQVLQQAGTAMVAQANAIPQNVLSLLR